jgi:FMN phosphatase YigB (HAD superfamily)
MVGDDYEKYVLAARSAGLRAIHVSTSLDRSHAETVTSLWEVADLLFGAG